MTEEELKRLQKEREELQTGDNLGKFVNDPKIPNPQAEMLKNSSDPYVQSLFGEQVKDEGLTLNDPKKKVLKQPNHHHSNSAFTDMWFLGILTLILEPLMIFLVYLFIK